MTRMIPNALPSPGPQSPTVPALDDLQRRPAGALWALPIDDLSAPAVFTCARADSGPGAVQRGHEEVRPRPPIEDRLQRGVNELAPLVPWPSAFRAVHIRLLTMCRRPHVRHFDGIPRNSAAPTTTNPPKMYGHQSIMPIPRPRR